MSLASSIALLDEQLSNLKEDYRTIWREKMGGDGRNLRDPFAVAKEERKGREGLEGSVRGMSIR